MHAQPEKEGAGLGKEGGGLPSTLSSADVGREQHGVEAMHMLHSGRGLARQSTNPRKKAHSPRRKAHSLRMKAPAAAPRCRATGRVNGLAEVETSKQFCAVTLTQVACGHTVGPGAARAARRKHGVPHAMWMCSMAHRCAPMQTGWYTIFVQRRDLHVCAPGYATDKPRERIRWQSYGQRHAFRAYVRHGLHGACAAGRG